MSYRNNHSGQRNRHHTDPSSSRQNTKYNQRNGQRNYRPEPSRRLIGNDDVDSLMSSLDNHLTTNVQDSSTNGRGGRYAANRRPTRSTPQMRVAQSNQTGWWRITVPDAGNIGKERVMSALRAHCPRQFQAYHYAIDVKNKAGVFFVNSQQDADMLKRANNKVDVQGLDIIRVQVSRVPAPAPAIDEDARPHFRDFLLNRRFDQQMLKLDLSHLADDEELSSLGIYPQFNKHAFVRDVVNIVNAHIPTTRQLDLGSNNIVNLYEFRNLHLENLMLLSLASNQLKNVDDFDHLKQLPHLAHVYINNNPLVSTNSKRNTSLDDVISTIRQKLPQLKRIDNVDLPPTIRFATDIETTALPASQPHCVPHDMQGFLKNFIDEYFRLFDTRGRGELHACYHDTCMLSLCIAAADSYIVPTRQFKFGALIYESRNLQKIADDNKRMMLLRHGKTAVIDFLRIKFPLTQHDDTSFHVDVISTANNRAIFTVNGLYKEVEQTTNCPIRSFQRTFTCAQTATGVLIIADHILITNATDTQISKMNRSTPAPAPVPTLQPANVNNDVENQMVLKFSQQSGMNIAYSKLCLQENNWNYDKAAEVFLAAHEKKLIPSEAFSQS